MGTNSGNHGNFESELFVIVAHGPMSDLSDLVQIEELTNPAKYVQQKTSYAGGFGVTAREFFPILMSTAIVVAGDII